MLNMVSPQMGGQFMWGSPQGQGQSSPFPAGSGSGWATPPPMPQNTQRNPQLAALQDEYANYRKNLSAGTDQDAVNALARNRDLTSGMAKEAGDAGMFRAGAGGVAAELSGRVFSRGQAQAGQLNADMAADARRLQLNALQGQTGAASAEASANLGQQHHALNQWQAYQNAQQSNAQMFMNQQNQQVGTLMQMLQTLGPGGMSKSPYTGFRKQGITGTFGRH